MPRHGHMASPQTLGMRYFPLLGEMASERVECIQKPLLLAGVAIVLGVRKEGDTVLVEARGWVEERLVLRALWLVKTRVQELQRSYLSLMLEQACGRGGLLE